MTEWKPDPILKAIVFWIKFLLVFSWLPLLRILFDGDSYRWGTNHFGFGFASAGWGADAWLLVFKSALLIGLLWGALRGANRLFQWGLLVWSVVLAADITTQFVRDPSGFEFHGDTLGIHLNLGWAVVAVTAAFAAMGSLWAYRELRSGAGPRAPAWTDWNRRALGVFLLLLPIQFLLLRPGAPHGTTDAVGVLITIASVPFLAWALYPRRSAAP